MKKISEQERVQKILEIFDREYPDPKPPLTFSNAFESLIATILSAQCTDARVNMVTPALFKAANTPAKMRSLSKKELISFIRSTGFFNAKATNILATCAVLVEKYNGVVPHTMEELTTLPGVGRKTASVVLSQAFGIPAFPVDRHVFRVANRLALAHSKTPDQTDLQLRKKIPKNLWIKTHLQIIFLGRSYCRPKPLCPTCPFLPHCPYGQKVVKMV